MTARKDEKCRQVVGHACRCKNLFVLGEIMTVKELLDTFPDDKEEIFNLIIKKLIQDPDWAAIMFWVANSGHEKAVFTLSDLSTRITNLILKEKSKYENTKH